MKAQSSSASLDALGRELQLVFPASARLIGVERESGMDDRVRIKLELATQDLRAFLAHTPIDPATFRPGPRGYLGQDKGFWDPHQAAKLRTAQSHLAANRVLNIGLDESRTDVIAVYIVNHGT